MLTKWPPLTRTEELEPAFTRQNIAEWAINVLKYHLHANTGTTHSSRPGQRELLISRIHYITLATLHCALADATSWKISDEEDKNISYKLYPGSRGAGRREAGLSRGADQPTHCPQYHCCCLQDQVLRSTEVKSDHRSRCWSSIYCTRCNGENV